MRTNDSFKTFFSYNRGVEYYYYRGRKCKDCGKPMPIFGLGHYYPKDAKAEDDFSKKLNYFYMYGNETEFNYFLEGFVDLYKKRIEGDIRFDFVTVCPSHEAGKVNEHIVKLAKMFSKATGIEYKELLKRTRAVTAQHLLGTDKERMDNVAESITAEEGVEGKNILVIDNTSISGSTVREVHRAMKKGGANSCVFLCLGLGHKGKDVDFDINPNFKGKISVIISNWHWPKVSKEKRAEFKSKV